MLSIPKLYRSLSLSYDLSLTLLPIQISQSMYSILKRLPALLLFTLSVPSFSKDLSGTWLVVPKSREGIAQWQIFTFSKQGDMTSGTTSYLPALDKGLTLKGVRIHGDDVHFGSDGGNHWEGKFADDNELHLTWSAETGDWLSEEIRLKRLSAGQLAALKTQVAADHARLQPLPAPPVKNVPSNGLASKPIMGWNSWNHYSSAVDDKAIRAAADALVSTGLRDAGYVYVDIDDGWQGSRDQNGILHPNEKFPDMKGLADYIHSKGLKFGIYSSPGPFTCANYIGSHGYEAQDAKTFAAWGVDLLKYDWCSAGDIYRTKDEMRGRYQIMGAALEATGRPIVYSLCQHGLLDVGQWGRGVGGNLWRISEDSILVTRWTAINSRFETHGDPKNSGPGGWNDPDMLLIGNGGLNTEEYRTHLTLWVMLAAPLILGNDLQEMTPDIREMLLNRDIISVDQDSLGKQGHRILKQGNLEIWSKPLANREFAVALFNRGATAEKAEVRWSDLRLSNRVSVRNLWETRDLGRVGAAYSTTVPSHGSVLLKLSGT